MKYTYVYLSAQLLTTPCVYNFSSDSDYFCHVYLRLMVSNSNSQMTAKENVSNCWDSIMHNFLHCELRLVYAWRSWTCVFISYDIQGPNWNWPSTKLQLNVNLLTQIVDGMFVTFSKQSGREMCLRMWTCGLWKLIIISVACAVGPSVTTSSIDFSFQNLVIWNLFEFSAAEIT